MAELELSAAPSFRPPPSSLIQIPHLPVEYISKHPRFPLRRHARSSRLVGMCIGAVANGTVDLHENHCARN